MSTICSLVAGVCLLVCVESRGSGYQDPFLVSLFDRVSREQVLKDEPFEALRSWQKIKGVYPSNIRFNFHGKFVEAEIRRLFTIFDNNIFATAWVTSSILEAFKYGGAPRPREEQLLLTINTMKEFQDKNSPYNTSITTFWQQQYNQSTNYWECVPVNLLGSVNLLNHLPMPFIEKVLKFLGFEDIARYLEYFTDQKDVFLKAFHIPPDFDDTFVNLGLGSLLYQERGEFPRSWQAWSDHNSNITSVFDSLKKYAYRPFSNDPDASSIDPRTYFYIREYLDHARANGQDIALVPTWVQSIEDVRKQYHLGVAMPFQVNNHDVTVAANAIFGITSAVLSAFVSPQVLEDPLIKQIYLNTTSLIAHQIARNFSGRPDLALTYYLSRVQFYWFVARTVNILESARRSGPFPAKVMDTVYRILRRVTEDHVTEDILRMASQDRAARIYLDDFLGDGDLTYNGRQLRRAEDRTFSTSMAVNALLSVWTYQNESSAINCWKKGTPKKVWRIVRGCVRWLRKHTTDGNFEPWNAFFSGSTKSDETLPFWYPGNRLEYLNGTRIFNWTDIPDSTFIYAVQGYIPADQYKAMLREPHFGQFTPLKFPGYNNGSSYFPFWSSVSYTYSTVLLAVSRFGNTESC